MRIKCTKNSVYLGTQWTLVIFCVIGAAFCCVCLDDNIDTIHPFLDSWQLALLGLFTAVLCSKSVKIDSKGFTTYYLGIPINYKYWCDVMQITLAPYSGKKEKKDTLLIIWEPGPKFTGEATAYRFNYQNPRTSYIAVLPVSDNKLMEIVDIMNVLIAEHEHLAQIVI